MLKRLDKRLKNQTAGIHYAAYALNSQASEAFKTMSKREWLLAKDLFGAIVPSHLHDDFFTLLSEFRSRKERFSSTFLRQRAHNPGGF